jgi:hypothetical protein
MDALSHAVAVKRLMVKLEQEWRTFLRTVRGELSRGRFSPELVESAEDIEELLETLFTHTHAVKHSLAEYQRVFTFSAIPAKTQFEVLNRQLSRIDFDSISEQTKRKL